MQNMHNTIQCGDATTVLAQLPRGSVDLVVTSPPYYKQRSYNDSGLGIGQEYHPDGYLESLFDTLSECVRVLKPTGNIVYNLGDKYIDGCLMLLPFRFALMACERLPLKLINEITWVKRNPTPRQFNRRLVPSTEPFFHFAISKEYYYDRNNFCRNDEETKREMLPSVNLGAKYRKDIIDSDVLTDTQKHLANRELDEVIAEVHAGIIQGFRMKIRGIHAEAFGGQEGGRKGQMDRKGFTIIRIKGEKMKRDVIETSVESLPGNAHTAIFPLKIIREMIRLLCPLNGLVVDPYVGSGTSAVAAVLEGRDYLGIDIDPMYCESAKQRILEVTQRSKNVA